MIASDYSVPDLLRRFVPTPFTAVACVDGTRIVLQTNDPALVNNMQRLRPDLAANPSHGSLAMKIVRDNDAPAMEADVTVIEVWPLTTLLAGVGTVLTLDHQRCELFGFLAPSITADRFFLELLPVLLRRFHDAGATQPTSFP